MSFLKWAAAGAAIAYFSFYFGLAQRAIGHLALYMEQQKMKLVKEMRPKRIIIMRHAESEGNVNQALFETIPDSAMCLSETGYQQAEEAGCALKELLQDETIYCFVSPFRRALQTLAGVLESFDEKQVLGVREDSRLREQEWGNFQQPSEIPRIKAERMRVGRFWYRFTTGESGADVFGRADAFMDTLYRTVDAVIAGRQEVENILIVTHGLTARFLMMRYFRWSISTFESVFNLRNAEFVVLKKNESGKYQLCSDEGSPLRSHMNVTVTLRDGTKRQMVIPDYITIHPPRKLNRPEILRRLGLDGKDVVQIDFHAIPHESANASRTCRDSSGRSVLEVEHSNLVQDTNLRLVETESDFTRSIGLMRSKFGSFS
eukprot:EG_transcript_16712